MLSLLTIAGFDPSSGAGITADLMVFAAHGFFGTSCVTALTVQSTTGVEAVEPVRASTVLETLACLQLDLPPSGIKIGMLATAANVNVVADYLSTLRNTNRSLPVVLDPVLRSSSGRDLLTAEGLAMMRSRLLPLVDWVTPNLGELGILTGLEVALPEHMEEGARRLQQAYPGVGVVVTGGHLENCADDLLVEPGGLRRWFGGARLESDSTHGTGCAFSSAMLCGLAGGLAGADAAGEAKRYVAGAIRHAVRLGSGNGPIQLLWPLERLSVADGGGEHADRGG